MQDGRTRRAAVSAPLLDLRRDLEPGAFLTFGRDPTADLCFPGDGRLSRHAGEVRWGDDGVLVCNLSRGHSLFVATSTGSAELEPVGDQGSAAAFVLRGGVATVSLPWPDSDWTLVVELAGLPRVAPEPSARSAPTTADHAFQLQEDTKLFVTALMLCRSRLTATPGGSPVTPSVPELTRQILEVTDSHHLLRQFDDTEGAARKRLTGQVHDQLKELRAKILKHGLAPSGSRLPPAALAELLIRSRIITKRHLLLLGDPEWRTAQYRRWW